MAVEFDFGSGWKRDKHVVKTMHEVATTPKMAEIYRGLNPTEKAAFERALSNPAVVPLNQLRSQTGMPSQPAPTGPIPDPQSIAGSTKDVVSFKRWLVAQGELVNKYAALKFELGESKGLHGGTVSVPVHISKNGMACRSTNFCFHYHPGASGPGVGAAHASEGHFKPGDHGTVRVKKSDVEGNRTLNQLWKDARRIAR